MASATGIQPHVFVSYSRHNTEAMQRVSQALRQANIPVWTDERLTAGTPSWKNAIEYAIQGAFCVVVLMSPTAKTSEWVERELDYAYVLQCPIYPLLVEGSQRDAVPFELINMQYIDARTDFDQGMKNLIALLAPYAVLDTAVSEVDPKEAIYPPEQIAATVVVPEQSSNMPPSILDMLLYRVGIITEDPHFIAQHITRSRRLIHWYFWETHKFRKFSALSQDSTARFIHSSVIAVANLWVLGWAWLLYSFSTSRSPIAALVIPFVTICYGIAVLVPLTTPYKTRRAFFASILYGIFLLVLIVVLLWIAIVLTRTLLDVLEAV